MTEVEKLRAGLVRDFDNEDADIERIAIQRLAEPFSEKRYTPFDEVLRKFNITQKDLDDAEDVEFE